MNSVNIGLAKCATGIQGLDEITKGGLPQGRPTLICGGPGSGKTFLAIEFLLRGAKSYQEPGVFISFEETIAELRQNVASLGVDLENIIAEKKLVLDHIQIEREDLEEVGEYNLEGLFIRLNQAIDSIKAQRVVLDTIENLFAGLSNTRILRAELGRLFRWLKEKGVTAIITAERGTAGNLTHHGIEEYVSDCVILLDHRVEAEIATRRLRVVKYRGSSHGTNEYPFLINEQGISVVPITSINLKNTATSECISSGIPQLDAMMSTKGYFRGSTILVSGTTGTGKTSFVAYFVDAACRQGERCLYFAFEESVSQILRNMSSIGLDLAQWVKENTLFFQASRPTWAGLEMHLASMYKLIREFKPTIVVVDPITDLEAIGTENEVKDMLMRLVDLLKMAQITTLFTSLTRSGSPVAQTDVGVSPLIDTWLLLHNMERSGELNRGIQILKSRGMAHSNQIREFVLNKGGIELLDVYLGAASALTGSARVAQEAQEKEAAQAIHQEIEQKRRNLERKRKALEAQIAALKAEFNVENQELETVILQEESRENQSSVNRHEMAKSRKTGIKSEKRTRKGD